MRAALAMRNHPAYWAFVAHRASGLGLALFLPFHFLALGLAINGEAQLENFIRWTDNPLVKLAETVLVALLAVHLAGGIRLLLLEFGGMTEGQKTAITISFGFALLSALLFLLVSV
ncbi:MAG: succinate dehydrogenase, cytochrome b556 subunit [Pseudomonadota bacterium]